MIDNLGAALLDLDAFLRESLIRSGRLSFRAWTGINRSKLEVLKQTVDDARRNLDTLISSAQLRTVPLLQGAIESVTVTGTRQYNHISDQLAQIMGQLQHSAAPTRQASNLRDGPILSEISTLIDSDGSSSSVSEEDNSMVCIETSVASRKCDARCACQCHVRTSVNTPQWLAVVFGSMFYYSSGRTASSQAQCSTAACSQSTGMTSHVTYYFPTWLLRSSLTFSTWHDLHGANATWSIKMPRIVPDSARCWDLIRLGKIEDIRELLERREMSPYDVAADGVSVLRVRPTLLPWSIMITNHQ
jgi:hypothetical protein